MTLLTVFLAGENVVMAVDRVAMRCPVYRLPRDLVLDTILSPAEEWDYVSTTAPSSPPPTDS